jgi:hypothetical protein
MRQQDQVVQLPAWLLNLLSAQLLFQCIKRRVQLLLLQLPFQLQWLGGVEGAVCDLLLLLPL